MVAAVAIKLIHRGGSKVGSVRCLSVLPTHQNCGAGTMLLKRAESVCRGLGCGEVNVDVMMRLSRVKSWLTSRGYKSRGGGAWTGDGCAGDAVPYLTFAKDLSKPPESTSNNPSSGSTTNTQAEAPAPPPDALLSFASALLDAFRDMPVDPQPATQESLPPAHPQAATTSMPLAPSADAAEAILQAADAGCAGSEGGGAETLEGLLGVLMGQLGTPSGREQFEALVAAQDGNVLGTRVDPTIFDDEEFEILEVGVRARED
jgi:hypothetical protein